LRISDHSASWLLAFTLETHLFTYLLTYCIYTPLICLPTREQHSLSQCTHALLIFTFSQEIEVE